ncbi:flagellar outer arm dynein-associated protein, putative [Plasmodium vinckei]|uniref:Dynein light chain roadblock n=5 Tax=Plasmodium vinckei TaxID=5860 RepID=A0A449BP22_PLAVN|nr:flagellar outer arm dynein-associated protein, putative [Plasmodium vinckei vinckei]CAD2086788.1 flagellar outer arm dynein-associated protein, putative [Plasmodium vinckei lentum]CAD2086810.1 flagellar outer arm dynein-associated protein, putative [Plasmodium vinckei brucechwatti]CAD2112083.1 flagellar outer arm dynein-associated protein, putative [Plasmodium vinckei]CAD2112247.1 flagellar outer arm dynein-associated protein, putative [Plasmodium vinckei petteri]VEV55163.1 flagellar outer 
MSESEEILNRIKSYRGVVGVLVVNNEGLIIKSTFDQQQSDLHASLLTQLSTKARDIIRELDPQNDISFLRLRSKKHEIMIAPDKDYTLIVVQNPYADKDKN